MTMQQDIFLRSEGDAWLRRNESVPGPYDWQASGEVRLEYLAQTHGHRVTRRWTDAADEWVSLACLRKCRPRP